MSSSQCAEIDPDGGRVTIRWWAVNLRIEPPQPQLLDQTCIFFNYF